MNVRKPTLKNKNQLSIHESYLSTLQCLKSLAKEPSMKVSKAEYEQAFTLLKNLNSPAYSDSHQAIQNILLESLQYIPQGGAYIYEEHSVENAILFLEQCSPMERRCLFTNEVIPPSVNTPQFVFMNRCGLSETGLSQLMAVRGKYEDNEIGLSIALAEITHPLQQEKQCQVRSRDITRLRLHIEKETMFAPTYCGAACGFILASLTPFVILNIVSLSLLPLLILAVLAPILGIAAGIIIEKELAKKYLKKQIGPTPVFILGSTLDELFTIEKQKSSANWCCLFSWRTTNKTSVDDSPKSYMSP